MRFTKSFALLAVLALCLTPFMSYADSPKSAPVAGMPNLTVERSYHASATEFAIVNNGLADAGAFNVHIELSTGAVYNVTLAGLAAGAVMPVQIPAAQDGKPFGITIDVDYVLDAATSQAVSGGQVVESDESDNEISFQFIG
jgi:hypothetical protein